MSCFQNLDDLFGVEVFTLDRRLDLVEDSKHPPALIDHPTVRVDIAITETLVPAERLHAEASHAIVSSLLPSKPQNLSSVGGRLVSTETRVRSAGTVVDEEIDHPRLTTYWSWWDNPLP
jgi:hypothetical protein